MHNLEKAGTVGKPHGIKGFVSLHLNSELNWEKVKVMFVQTEERPVPYIIIKIIFFEKKIIAQLENINSVDDAKKLCNKNIFIEKQLIVQDDTDMLINYSVIDVEYKKNYLIGKVVDWMAQGNTQWLMLISSEQNEIILPFNEELIASIDDEKKIIYYKAVEGMY